MHAQGHRGCISHATCLVGEASPRAADWCGGDQRTGPSVQVSTCMAPDAGPAPPGPPEAAGMLRSSVVALDRPLQGQHPGLGLRAGSPAFTSGAELPGAARACGLGTTHNVLQTGRTFGVTRCRQAGLLTTAAEEFWAGLEVWVAQGSRCAVLQVSTSTWPGLLRPGRGPGAGSKHAVEEQNTWDPKPRLCLAQRAHQHRATLAPVMPT